MFSKEQCRKIWLYGNITFLSFYSLFLVTIIIRIPYLKSLPAIFSNIPLTLSYLVTLVDYYPSKLPSITTDSNFYAALLIYSMSNSFRIFMLPFYIFSIVNLASFICSNRKDFEHSEVFAYSTFVMDNKKNMLLTAYIMELILPVLLFLKGILFFGMEFFSISLAIALLRYEYKNSFMKKAFNIILSGVEKVVSNSPVVQKQFNSLKFNLQEKMKYKLD